MENTYFLEYYVIVSAFIFIFSAYIFVKLSRDVLRKSEFIVFRAFIVSFQFYLLMNTVWTLCEFEVIRLPNKLFTTVCLLSFASVAYIAFAFYCYTIIHFNLAVSRSKWANILGFMPLAAAFVMLLVSLRNGMIFSVTPEGHIVNGPAYIALPICSFVYFIVIAAVAVYKTFKVRSNSSRRNALSIIGSVVFLIVWVLLDAKFDRITIIPIAVFSVIFFLFINIQQSSIYTDALTGLNNRRRSEEYLVDMLENVSEQNPFYLFIGDLNSFKKINDKYGHIEGDNALVVFANVLKEHVAANFGFAARYGGDEFIWTWRPSKEDFSPESVISAINSALKDRCREEYKEYTVTVSIGYAICADPRRSTSSYIKEADEMLYANKKVFHNKTA